MKLPLLSPWSLNFSSTKLIGRNLSKAKELFHLLIGDFRVSFWRLWESRLNITYSFFCSSERRYFSISGQKSISSQAKIAIGMVFNTMIRNWVAGHKNLIQMMTNSKTGGRNSKTGGKKQLIRDTELLHWNYFYHNSGWAITVMRNFAQWCKHTQFLWIPRVICQKTC